MIEHLLIFNPDWKTVYFIFSHDTSRVFADLQEDCSPAKTSYDTHYIGHAHLSPQQSVMSGHNKPHPTSVTFLRQNPRFICEPICYVKTSVDTPVTYPAWWPDESPEKPAKVPKHSFDSTSRTDYRRPPVPHDSITRYSSNLAMQVTPGGIIPQGNHNTGLKAPKVVEKISYEHQFNSRLDPSHPIRGRRHGSFIWKVIPDVGKPNWKHSKTVEYALKKEESAKAETAETTGNSSKEGAKIYESEFADTLSTSVESS